MIHHLDIAVTDLARSEVFYTLALEPLGMTLVARNEANSQGGTTIGFGPASSDPLFWIRSDPPPSGRVHVAFAAASPAAVCAFHANALSAGGSDNGSPGFRHRYGDGYYAAFVLDPDGHNIEAVYREPGQVRAVAWPFKR